MHGLERRILQMPSSNTDSVPEPLQPVMLEIKTRPAVFSDVILLTRFINFCIFNCPTDRRGKQYVRLRFWERVGGLPGA